MTRLHGNAAARLVALCVFACAAFGAAPALTDEIYPYLGPPGVDAGVFPKPSHPVASIISPIWHNETERDAVNEAGELIRLMDLKPGMTVADIGAGSGYYTVKLSALVGAGGRVLAQDVAARYLRGLADRVRSLNLTNVQIGLGEAHDPRLPIGALDAAIMIHMYHEIGQPFGLLYNLAPALKPGAKVGIVDAVGKTQYHGTPPALLRCELAAAGYRETGFFPLKGGETYLAVFQAPLPEQRPAPQAIVPCNQE